MNVQSETLLQVTCITVSTSVCGEERLESTTTQDAIVFKKLTFANQHAITVTVQISIIVDQV